LCLILLPALSNGNRVLENTLVTPELEFLETGSACEKIEDTSYDSLLVRGEIDAGSGLDVGAFDVEITWQAC